MDSLLHNLLDTLLSVKGIRDLGLPIPRCKTRKQKPSKYLTKSILDERTSPGHATPEGQVGKLDKNLSPETLLADW